MFCMNCGKEVDSNANYCPGCGAELGKRPGIAGSLPSVNLKRVASNYLEIRRGVSRPLVVMLVITFFIMISGFFPVVRCHIDVMGWRMITYRWNLLDFRKVTNIMENFESSDLVIIKIFMTAIVVFYISGVISGIFLLKNFFINTKQELEDMAPFIFATSIATEIAYLLILFTGAAVDSELDYALGINNAVGFTLFEWLFLLLPIINIVLYQCQHAVDKKRRLEKLMMDNNTYKEKTCLLCKTRYTLGNKCPKCGSTAIEEM